jgi:hypothetical protein
MESQAKNGGRRHAAAGRDRNSEDEEDGGQSN